MVNIMVDLANVNPVRKFMSRKIPLPEIQRTRNQVIRINFLDS